MAGLNGVKNAMLALADQIETHALSGDAILTGIENVLDLLAGISALEQCFPNFFSGDPLFKNDKPSRPNSQYGFIYKS